MRLTTRIHEWIAERVSWVPYPDVRPRFRDPFPPQNLLRQRLYRLRGWIAALGFLVALYLSSLYGNSIR